MIEPMTPADCDLRGMPFMPLDVVRLGDSDLVALSTGDEFKAAVMLWCKSWLQIPAASLPDDDRILAHLSGAGARWSKVKDMALRGWIKATDGRLYHPVVAEKAIEAWRHRQMQRARANKRWGNADAQGGGNADDMPPHVPAQSHGDAAAYPAAMQGTGTVKGQKEETPLTPTAGAVGGMDASQSLGRRKGLRALGTSPRQVAAAERAATPPPPDPEHDLWPVVRDRTSASEFRATLGKASVERINGHVTLTLPTKFLADHVRQHWGAVLPDLLGRPVEIEVAA